jgi:hypothetical protein
MTWKGVLLFVATCVTFVLHKVYHGFGSALFVLRGEGGDML